MRKITLQTLDLPAWLKDVALRLLAGIEVAETSQALYNAAHRAEGFVLGLETARWGNAELIEAMYIGFETAAEQRLCVLRQT